MLNTFLLLLVLPVLQQPPQGEVLPLRVEDVVRMATTNAPAIKQAELQAQATAAGVLQAGGAYDYTMFADTTYSLNERPTSGGIFNSGLDAIRIRSWNASQGLRKSLMSGGSFEISVSETYTEDNQNISFFGFNPESNVGLNFSFTQPLLRGGWSLTATQALRTAQFSSQAASEGARAAIVDATQAAVDAYWNLAFSLEDVKVKELSLRLAEELRDLTQTKFEVGTAAEVEVVQTEADIALRTEALLTAKNTVKQAEDILRQMIFDFEDSQDWNLELSPVSELPPPVATDIAWEVAYQVALAHRADLERNRIDAEQKKLDWDVARHSLRPKLDFVVTGSSAGVEGQIHEAFDVARGFYYTGYSIGLNFEMPIGNHTYQGAAMAARRSLDLAQRVLRDTENAIAIEVRDAVRNVNYLSERVAATALASQVAERQLEAEQRRLREGASTNFQVLQFQRDLEQALTSEKNSRMEYAKAAVKLFTVQGLNWDGSVFES